MGTLEILAIIFIALAVIKLIVIAISPKAWFNFMKKLWAKPDLVALIALILAAIVLYYLMRSGVTIIDILAVTVFVVLLGVIGVSRYTKEIFAWISKKDLTAIIKEMWLYILIWFLLLIWGIKEIFF